MRKHIAVLALASLAGPIAAQTSPQVTNDLTINMTPQQYRICNDRPARPTWMDDINPREAYKATALMELYEIRTWEAIMATGDCGCDVRFPAWDSVDGEYHEAYAGYTQAEHSALRRDWIAMRKQLEPQVREICEAQGNW
ncbi:hypothetical protein [Pseudogemmobacter sp. W21_MBD1_M6]|uniref:hypothetical protein n=1 Tax=Pseudogemmobacter sp. W21_MBD1_M6 TaxID=3240271 RepID=UPI003F9741FE